MASPPAVHVHRRPPLPAARHAPVIEIDPPNDPRGTGQIDRAGARVLLEIQPRSGRERVAVPKRDLHIEQLQVLRFFPRRFRTARPAPVGLPQIVLASAACVSSPAPSPRTRVRTGTRLRKGTTRHRASV